jgi:excisionase family DNA binding protein
MSVLTVKEVAERMKCTPLTVAKWMKAGKMPGVKGPGGWRVAEDALEKYLRGEWQVDINPTVS